MVVRPEGTLAFGSVYFMPKKVVRTAHPSSGENDVYRLWMATEVHCKMCVYGDYRGRSHSFLCNLKSKLYFLSLSYSS